MIIFNVKNKKAKEELALEKLRNTQLRIEELRTKLYEYRLPNFSMILGESTLRNLVENIFQAMTGRLHPFRIFKGSTAENERKYVKELGKYLIFIVDCEEQRYKHELELSNLLKQEKELKDILGIK